MWTVLGVIVAIVVCIVTYFKVSYQYWSKYNLYTPPPSIPLGNLANPGEGKQSIGEMVKGFYDDFKKRGLRHGGVYFLTIPNYIPVDLEIIKRIMVRDFDHFTDRGIYYNEKNDPLSAHLFAIDGKKWKNLRTKMTPTFTAGKMKMMLGTLNKSCKVLVQAMEKYISEDKPIDIKEVISYFAIDVIGSCAFGLECNSFGEEESPFSIHGKQFFRTTTFGRIYQNFLFLFPNFSKSIGLRLLDKDMTDFFYKVVKEAVEYREKNNVDRKDFLQILIDLKNNKLDNEIEGEHDGKSLTMEEIAAQCLVFFIGGFETNSSAMSLALLELSRNQDIQEKVREEVVGMFKRHNTEEISYENLAELKYLGQVIDESMRLYPPVPFLSRECIKDYKIPDSDVIIKPGTRCQISVLGIHRDEDIYPDPEVFDPDRFSDENRGNIKSCTYLPFGEGPRNCIGLRFALMEAKIGLATLLRHFRFTLDKKTKLPIKFSNSSVVMSVEGDVWLRAEKVE